jgi:hypothetical protein
MVSLPRFVLRTLCFVALCCAAVSCTNSDGIEITPSFDPEIESQQNLEFTVSKDLCPDSLQNQWDSTALLEISPAVKGIFKWSGSHSLIFSPARGFEPGTTYTARPTNLLFRHYKGKDSRAVSSKTVTFHTAPLRVVNAVAGWARAANQTDVVVQLDLLLNYDVNLAEAAKQLHLQANGRDVAITQMATGTGRALTVQFAAINNKDAETPLSVTLGKGIVVQGSNYSSVTDTTFTTSIPSRYTLLVTGVVAQHTGTEGVITVSTSQPILQADLREAISLQPAVPFDVTVTDGGFTIRSASLSQAQVYELQLAGSAEGTFGGRMKAPYTTTVAFGKLSPAVSFANSKGIYLTGGGYRNIALNIVNVASVDVALIKVFENNMEQFLRKDVYYDYHYNEETEEGSSYEYYETENLGDTIFHKVYETSKLPRQNAAHVLHLDFEDRLKSYNGIYVLRIMSRDHYWIQQSKIISISDIGLIVKEEQDNMYVFANSLRQATPMAGVGVMFTSTTNQKMQTITTDADGVAVFKNISKTNPGFRVGMVTAKKGDDFTFLWPDKTRTGTSRYDVGGRIPNSTGLIAMIHPERNLYRPGETIKLQTIVRTEQWQVPQSMPVKVRLVMPGGREMAAIRRISDAQGASEYAFPTPPGARTGTYVVEVYTGNDVLLTSANISVEEFMPDRIKVAVTTDKTEYEPGSKVTTTLQADNLYGTPAGGAKYQCSMELSKGTFSSDKYPDYSFAITGDLNTSPDEREGVADAKGSGTQVFDLARTMGDVGIVNGNISATVFDENSRPVHRYAHFVVYTQPVFVGVRCTQQYVTPRVAVPIGLLCMDKRGTLQASEADVVVVRKEWHTVIQKSGNSYRYVSQSEDVVVQRAQMGIAGAGTHYTFTAPQSGQYEVRFYAKGAAGYVSCQLYAWGWNDNQSSTFEVNNEGNVTIKANKKQYNVGDKADILFTTPFDGKLLVTLERDKLLKHYYLETKNKSASLSFDVTRDMLPNIYVAATLFRPMDGSDMPLTVAHGYEPLRITDTRCQLPVSVTVAGQSRSHKKQTIQVRTAPGASVVVAAVDEGILQIKGFSTPDPYGYFYQKVALAVSSYDIYPWLLPEVRTTLSTTGGDGAGYDGSRVNPLFVNRVKNVSFWSGILQADGSGLVKYDIDIPQFSGDIRVMAVACRNNAFGSAEQHIKVADPVVVSVSLPRFLSPGDEVGMPVLLTNTTSRAGNATVTVRTTGQVGITGQTTQEVTLPANGAQRALFRAAALPATGTATVTVSVKAMGETFENVTELSIRPPASLQKLTGSGFAPAGQTTAINTGANFLPTSFAGKVTVGASPLTQFTKHIEDLVQYPHGCVEQTTSAVFPQLYYADIVKSIRIGQPANTNGNIQAAITKLQSMQLGNGSLSYWPGGNTESWWGSIYACHFLLEARKAGFEVNSNTITRLQEYMKYRLYKKESITYYFNNNQKRDIAAKEIPYSLYVLALSGQPQLSDMNYYKAHRDQLSLDGRYLLAAAYRMAGMPAQAQEVQPPAFTGEIAQSELDGSFYSYIRDLAISLNCLLDTDPNNRQAGVIARQLTDQLARTPYTSTQEKAFAMLALGKVAKQAAKNSGTATVNAGGRAVATSAGPTVTASLAGMAGQPLSVAVAGTGGFYYSWQVSGLTADGSYKQEDSRLKVRRRYLDRKGHELTTNFRQNDLIVVCITIEAQTQDEVPNVVITDMLPAGFEPENTRLTALPQLEWIKDPAEPDYTDIRDDRVNMFVTAGRKPKSYYYMVRAVTPGTYKLGPVQADAMYDGNYHSYHGAATIHITE